MKQLPKKHLYLVLVCVHRDGGTLDFVALGTGLELDMVHNIWEIEPHKVEELARRM